jgi:hypothetical protein
MMIVCIVAGLEAVAIAFLLANVLSRAPATSQSVAGSNVSAPPAASPTNGPAPAPAVGRAEPSRGKQGQKVASGGFAITVEKIVHEPTYKELASIGPDQRYLALLVAVENDTGHNADVYPSQFTLKDGQGYNYDRLNLQLTIPALEWRRIGNRETAKGYVNFAVPKAAKGLVLVYPREPQPIYIELAE